MSQATLEDIINYAFNQMRDFIMTGEDGYSYILDPNDQARVIGHYGETHLCAAMLYYADRSGNDTYRKNAIGLLKGVLAHWDVDQHAKDNHDDFNNFALALIYENLMHCEEMSLAASVSAKLLQVKDSKNRTVNWLPMRAYANMMRYELSGKDEYLKTAIEALEVVKEAQYADGMFDDLLPKGESFNLQYCISTAATIQLLYNRFEKYSTKLPKINIEKTMGTLYSLVLPDGDINYMGRGCNQIFAWGPWIYLMSVYKNQQKSDISLDFLLNRIDISCRKHNLMLNSYEGAERVLWWDYHHYTVYMAHFLLWNELSIENTIKNEITKLTVPFDSGLTIYQNNAFYMVTFTGRKHYLVEKGPAIVALWTHEKGICFKCGHAASNGMFSNLYFNPMTAYLNHFGVVSMDQIPKRFSNKLIRKLHKIFLKQKNAIQVSPVFSTLKVTENVGINEVFFESNGLEESYFLYPTYADIKGIRLFANDQEVRLRRIGTIQSQYGDISIYMSDVHKTALWKFVVAQ